MIMTLIIFLMLALTSCDQNSAESNAEPSPSAAETENSKPAQTDAISMTPDQSRSSIHARNGQLLLELDGNVIRSRLGQAVYEIQGNNLRSRNGQAICSISGNNIRSRQGQILYEISGNRIKAKSGQLVCTIDGNRIRARNGQPLYTTKGRVSVQTIALLLGANAINPYNE